MKHVITGLLIGLLIGASVLMGFIARKVEDASDLHKEKLRLEIQQLKNPKQHEKE